MLSHCRLQKSDLDYCKVTGFWVRVKMLDMCVRWQKSNGHYTCIKLPNHNPDTKTHL